MNATLTKFAADAANLPEFSRSILVALCNQMTDGEPGFTDAEAADLAFAVKCDRASVAGAIAKLTTAGLVTTERTEINGSPAEFLNVTVWDANQDLEFSLSDLVAAAKGEVA